MDCEHIRQCLRERFDDGRALTDGMAPHLDACPSCQEYVARLQALDAALADVPLEEASPELNTSVRENLAGAGAWPGLGYRAAGIAAAVAVTAGIVGWRLPIALHVPGWLATVEPWLSHAYWGQAVEDLLADAWLSHAHWGQAVEDLLVDAWLSHAHWGQAMTDLLAGVWLLWRQTVGQVAAMAGVSRGVLWAALSLTAVLLAGVNGVEAANLRSHTKAAGPGDRRSWSNERSE